MRSHQRAFAVGALRRCLVLLLVGQFSLVLGAWGQDSAPQTPDEVYGADEMERARKQLRHHVGGQGQWMFMADRFEFRDADHEDLGLFDMQGWIGGDIEKLWFKTEGEYSFDGNEFEELELQALYSRAISPYFNFNAGVRHDFEPGSGRTFAVIGLQGLAPYWFELDNELFISDDGDVEARIEAEYELLFTQRLVGQVRAEVGFSAQDIPELGIGSGLGSIEAGFRLRYEVVREFAPYVGIEWLRQFGATADFARAAGRDATSSSVVAGLRFWY